MDLIGVGFKGNGWTTILLNVSGPVRIPLEECVQDSWLTGSKKIDWQPAALFLLSLL
jgi:hypothetical protein